jgi:hypothetical protein
MEQITGMEDGIDSLLSADLKTFGKCSERVVTAHGVFIGVAEVGVREDGKTHRKMRRQRSGIERRDGAVSSSRGGADLSCELGGIRPVFPGIGA